MGLLLLYRVSSIAGGRNFGILGHRQRRECFWCAAGRTISRAAAFKGFPVAAVRRLELQLCGRLAGVRLVSQERGVLLRCRERLWDGRRLRGGGRALSWLGLRLDAENSLLACGGRGQIFPRI